ncbi:MAG: hypothetical protein R3349_00770, partial [Geminicoccaceae bacterium]|nr:hypothetical protein [Geminicoccaceae bacterium]
MAGAAENRLGSASAAAFLGLEGETLEARLGTPAFKRRDPPAEFWRYRIGPCALDLILYPHPEKPGPVVAY